VNIKAFTMEVVTFAQRHRKYRGNNLSGYPNNSISRWYTVVYYFSCTKTPLYPNTLLYTSH